MSIFLKVTPSEYFLSVNYSLFCSIRKVKIQKRKRPSVGNIRKILLFLNLFIKLLKTVALDFSRKY